MDAVGPLYDYYGHKRRTEKFLSMELGLCCIGKSVNY